MGWPCQRKLNPTYRVESANTLVGGRDASGSIGRWPAHDSRFRAFRPLYALIFKAYSYDRSILGGMTWRANEGRSRGRRARVITYIRMEMAKMRRYLRTAVATMLALGTVLVVSSNAFGQEEAIKANTLAANNGWMLICSALVLFMTAPGLAMFYGGLVRRKNVLSVMMQCVFSDGSDDRNLGLVRIFAGLWWRS